MSVLGDTYVEQTISAERDSESENRGEGVL